MDNILSQLANNQALSDAVKKAIEDEFALDDIDTRTMQNGQIGEVVRARLEGLKKIQEVFRKISKYKSIPPQPEKVNRAR